MLVSISSLTTSVVGSVLFLVQYKWAKSGSYIELPPNFFFFSWFKGEQLCFTKINKKQSPLLKWIPLTISNTRLSTLTVTCQTVKMRIIWACHNGVANIDAKRPNGFLVPVRLGFLFQHQYSMCFSHKCMQTLVFKVTLVMSRLLFMNWRKTVISQFTKIECVPALMRR